MIRNCKQTNVTKHKYIQHLRVHARPVDCFSKAGAYITQNATSPLGDITGGNVSGYVQLSLEPQNALYYFLISSIHQDLYTHFNVQNVGSHDYYCDYYHSFRSILLRTEAKANRKFNYGL